MYEPDYEQENVEGGVLCHKCGTVYTGFPFCKGYPESHGEMTAGGDLTPIEPYVDIQLLDRKDPRCTAVNELGIQGVPITSRGDRLSDRAHNRARRAVEP